MAEPPKNQPAGKKPARVLAGSLSGLSHALANMSHQAQQAARQRTRQLKAINDKETAALKRNDVRRLTLNALGKGQTCFPNTSRYGGVGTHDYQWICAAKSQYRYREQNWAAQESEVRVFIEGAEVTPAVRGNVNWSYQTTGGMNTCTFTLNNNQDAFMITPLNICAGTDSRSPGWRLSLKKGGKLNTSPGRWSRDVDETAKFIIYKKKYERVAPLSDNPKIDKDGVWLYPLDPWTSIFHTHDCVRVFARLPHVSGVVKYGKNGKVLEARELWAPVFTGFISDHDVDDNPVTGDRAINIRCYDYRGLLQRMRVRIIGNPLASEGQQNLSHSIFDKARAAKDKAAKAAGKGKGVADYDVQFLADIAELNISTDLVNWYRAAVSATASACATAKSGYDQDCIKQAADHVRAKIAQFVSELKGSPGGVEVDRLGNPVTQRTAFGNVPVATDPTGMWAVRRYLDECNKALSTKYTLARANETTIVLQGSSNQGPSVADTINKAIGFLKSTALQLVPYAAQYSSAYSTVFYDNEFRDWARSNHINLVNIGPGFFDLTSLSIGPGPADIIGQMNAKSAVEAVDNALKAALPQVYSVVVGTSTELSKVNRIYAIDKYIRDTAIALMQSLEQGHKQRIDDTYSDTAGSVQLSQGGRQVESSSNPVLFFPHTRTLGKSTYTATDVHYYTAQAVQGLITALATYATSTGAGKLADRRGKLDAAIQAVNGFLALIKKELDSATATANQAAQKDPNLRNAGTKERLLEAVEKAHRDGKAKKERITGQQEAGNIADLVVKDAKFSIQTAGMYSDLVKTMNRDAHPLAGMTFERAVQWLTLTNLYTSAGFEYKLSLYDKGKLEDWNHIMLFGPLGRPLTYGEVTELGQGTVTEARVDLAPFSPIHAFVHMLLPKDGTGATTIVQQDITHNPGQDTNYEYRYRNELLTEICETLDYQFFVTPYGDLAFEFPNYSALPYDFGDTFMGAYTVTRGLKDFKINTNESGTATGWVLTGSETEKIVDDLTGQYIAENTFKKAVFTADMLARRIGVKVKNLKMTLPGVGAALDTTGTTKGTPLSTLFAYALLEIQRELGRIESITVNNEYRPFLLPNRPYHVVHRQRIGLTKTINYSMAIGQGCDVQAELGYVRRIRRDGSFSFMTGGVRLPVDYSGLFSGNLKTIVKLGSGDPREMQGLAKKGIAGVGKMVEMRATGIETAELRRQTLNTIGYADVSNTAPLACGPYVQDAWIPASLAYSDNVDYAFRAAAKNDPYAPGTAGTKGGSGTALPKGTQSNIGARTYRVPANQGNPQKAVTLENTGVNEASGLVSGKDPTTTDVKTRLNNPWPYGVYDAENNSAPFNQWGYFRHMTTAGQLDKYSQGLYGSIDAGWHPGVDFVGVDKDTACYAPIELRWLFGTHYYGNDISSTTRWVSYPVVYDVNAQPLPPPKIVQDYGLVDSNGAPVVYEGKYWVDKIAYDIEQDRLQGTNIQRVHGTFRAGLTLTGFGFVGLPQSPTTQVACRLRYMHLNGFAKNPLDGKLYGDLNTSPNKRVAPADSVVCYVGNTGTQVVHLHFELMVYPPGGEPEALRGKGSTDTSAWKEILAANESFLRTSMRMKITTGKGNVPNGAVLSDEWRTYFEKINRTQGTNITTVDQAAEYLLQHSSKFRDNTRPTSGNGIQVNPFFFFRPEQIIKSQSKKYAQFAQRFGNVRFDSKKGSAVCGQDSALARQSIALNYSACLGDVKKQPGSNQWAARRKCSSAKSFDLALLKKTQTNKQSLAERSERKLNATVQRKVSHPTTSSRSRFGA